MRYLIQKETALKNKIVPLKDTALEIRKYSGVMFKLSLCILDVIFISILSITFLM